MGVRENGGRDGETNYMTYTVCLLKKHGEAEKSKEMKTLKMVDRGLEVAHNVYFVLY